MRIPIKLAHPDAKVPTKKNFEDAGWDLYSIEDKWAWPFIVTKIKTGVHIEIPRGHAGFIWDRSGMGIVSMIHRVAGVIDSPYRGELMVGLFRIWPWPKKIKKGDRIAQLVIQEVPLHVSWEEVEELSESDRGTKGLGSSGN